MTDLSQANTKPSQMAGHDFSQYTVAQLIDQMILLLQDEDKLETKTFEALYAAFHKAKRRLEVQTDADKEALLLQEARVNDLNQQFRSLYRKRSEALAALQLENGSQAEALLDELEALLASDTEFRRIYTRFHEIREAWQSLRPLTQQDESRLGKRFVQLRLAFYELKNINEELRDYDFRKNLEQKQDLLVQLRQLDAQPDAIHALEELSRNIVPRWRDIGPVAPAQREEVEGAYKTLSTNIFKRHQTYQEGLKAEEEQNAQKKQELITQIEAYVQEPLNSVSQWNEATEAVKQLQEAWRSIGVAGRKVNHELYQSYRQACDKFFEQKQAYFKQRSDLYEEGARQRRALIEKAIELAQGTKLAETTEALKALQEEWKKLPYIPKREGDALWEEFRKPFQEFFERKGQQNQEQRQKEKQAAEAKRQLLAELKALNEETELRQGLRDKLMEIKDQWRGIGRAGRKLNDVLWAEFCALNDTLFERLRASDAERRSESIRAKRQRLVDSGQGLQQELQFLHRKADRLRLELKNYENNINFLTNTGKSDNPLIKQVEQKRQRLIQDIARVEEELQLLQKQEHE